MFLILFDRENHSDCFQRFEPFGSMKINANRPTPALQNARERISLFENSERFSNNACLEEKEKLSVHDIIH